jgi:HSP20 family protein
VWYDFGVAFARWDPIRDLLALHQRLDRLGSLGPSPTGWAPPVDLHETPDAYVITAEVPGLSRDDVHIEMHDGRLTLSGTRPERGPCESYHRMERGHGAFSRTFQLPLPVDAEAITADLKDGVLTVTCPKAPEAGTRRIRIS